MVEKPTQSRERGQGENFPLQGQGTASLVGFGATPQQFHGRPVCQTRSTKAQAAKRPCQELCAPSGAPPSCSFQHQCCVAPDGRDRIAGLATIVALSRKQGISPLRRRQGGFPIAPLTPSGCTFPYLTSLAAEPTSSDLASLSHLPQRGRLGGECSLPSPLGKLSPQRRMKSPTAKAVRIFAGRGCGRLFSYQELS